MTKTTVMTFHKRSPPLKSDFIKEEHKKTDKKEKVIEKNEIK